MSCGSRHPRNAPGPFYVLNGSCISCGAPAAEATSLVTPGDDGCYFRKQPETLSEVDAAIRALAVSCVEAYRYDGRDPDILRRLAELGYAHLCNHPPPNVTPIIRNYVVFALDEADDARSVATRLVEGIDAILVKERCKAVTGDRERACFAFATSELHGARDYAITRVTSSRRLLMPYREAPASSEWLFAPADGARVPFVLHDVVVAVGATRIRWLSESEWQTRAPGMRLPY